MDNIVFDRGKYKGKTFKDVRINYPEYFMFLITKPAGNVVAHFDFIKYCMEYLTAIDDEED
jgi:hypothetical protein